MITRKRIREKSGIKLFGAIDPPLTAYCNMRLDPLRKGDAVKIIALEKPDGQVFVKLQGHSEYFGLRCFNWKPLNNTK